LALPALWLLGVVWLVVGGVVLFLFITRLGSTLPQDPPFRRRLAGWLGLLAVTSALYTAWALHTGARRTGSPSPPGWFNLRR
jgi:hypothetical protein